VFHTISKTDTVYSNSQHLADKLIQKHLLSLLSFDKQTLEENNTPLHGISITKKHAMKRPHFYYPQTFGKNV
jgi:hypothetical protein